MIESGPRAAIATVVDYGGGQLVAGQIADRYSDLRAAEVKAEHDRGMAHAGKLSRSWAIPEDS